MLSRPQGTRRQTRYAIRAGAIGLAIVASACVPPTADNAKKDAEELVRVQQRLQESERLNGRLMVRIEELEDTVFLLQDRVEAHRIALQRRGYMRTIPADDPKAQASRSAPPPQTYYGTNQGYAPSRAGHAADDRGSFASAGHRGTRIPTEWSHEDPGWSGMTQEPVEVHRQGELVITDREYQDFVAKEGGAPRDPAPAASKSSSKSKKRKAQPPVTSERLATSDTPAQPPSESAAPAPRKKSGLAGYKQALVAYRAGNYADALHGFEGFLAGGPRPDYLDNALYWIGECHFGLGQYDDAVGFFQRVLTEQPEGNKVPDAMLKMSLAYEKVGKNDEATNLLKDLTQQYPATNAGRLGAQRLEER
jgi:tol-pal system protein YbgF